MKFSDIVCEIWPFSIHFETKQADLMIFICDYHKNYQTHFTIILQLLVNRLPLYVLKYTVEKAKKKRQKEKKERKQKGKKKKSTSPRVELKT